jgi:tRNA-dependent cyclodipeptide synthase
MLDAVVNWISANFNYCVVLVGDSAHRITLRIARNMSEEEAEAKAASLGDAFIEENRSLFEAKMAGRFEFLKSSAIEEKPKCGEYKDTLTKMLENEEEFRSSVNQCAAAYVDRRLKNMDSAETSMTRLEMLALSLQYLIDEIAHFATISQMGKEIEVYPGEELSTLVEIRNGKHSNVPEPLKRRISVALKLKEIGADSESFSQKQTQRAIAHSQS